MKSTKKARSTKRTARARWPKGHPQAGKFAPADLFKEYQKNLRRQQKNQREREKRQKVRAERMEKMAGNATGSRVNDAIHGWGSTSTARLPEKSKTYWHGAFTVSGLSDAALRDILKRAGSTPKKPKRASDGTYSITLTPGYGWQTPARAFAADDNGISWLDARAAYWTRELSAPGASVTYHGAFYNPHRK